MLESGVTMCRVKVGADVSSSSDLQNLVTSVILRQTSVFSIADVCEKIEDHLNGSRFSHSPEIELQCKNTISTLFSIESIRMVTPGCYKLAMSFPAITT